MADFKKLLEDHMLKSVGYEKGQFDIKKQMAKNTLGGDDLLSTLIREKLGVKKEKKEKSPSIEGSEGLGTETVTMLGIIAKDTMVLPGMARDVKNLSQNIQKLVKLKGGKPTSSASDFFRKQKEKAASKITSKIKSPLASSLKKGVPEGPKSGIMDILGNIVGFIGGTLVEVVKALFNPAVIIGLLKRLALPLLIISTLFSGIMTGWKKYSKGGSFTEMIVSGFAGMLNFLTLGLLGEDQLKSVLSSLENLFKPVTDSVSKIFESIKGFFKNIFGDLIKEDEFKKLEEKEKTPEQNLSLGYVSDSEAINSVTSAPTSVSTNEIQNQKTPEQLKIDPINPEEANKVGAKLIEELTKMGVPEDAIPKNIFGDLAGVVNAGASDGFGSMISAGEKLNKKYSTTTPTSVTNASPLTSPTVIDKSKSTGGFAINIGGTELNFKNQNEYYDYVKNPQAFSISNIGGVSTATRLSKPPTDSGGTLTVSAPTGLSGGSGGGGSSGGSGMSASVEPMPPVGGASSGATISSSSAEVAEGQRMESSADQGTTIDASTTNNSSGSTGKPNQQIASAYDDYFAQRLAII